MQEEEILPFVETCKLVMRVVCSLHTEFAFRNRDYDSVPYVDIMIWN